jgi:hypothetical protein
MSKLTVASKAQYNHCEMMKSTVELFATRRMLLFFPVFLYLGIGQSFAGPIYSTSIAFTLAIDVDNNQLVALNLIVQGMGQITGKFHINL